MIKTFKYFSAALLSGVLLALSWPYVGDQEWLIFIAFLPLFWVENRVSQAGYRFTSGFVFSLAYVAFFVFNIWTTWWIKLASPGGMVLAVVFNTLFMAIVFTLFHFTRRKINDQVGYASFVFYWLGFEYLHINWELNWHWLNLGHVFANKIEWIQWYEYTGTLGGTFWVLAINAFVFFSVLSFLKANPSKRVVYTRLLVLALFVLLPFVISKVRFSNYQEKIDPIEVVVVQPNIDPYKDKFKGMHEHEQIDRMIHLAEEKVTPNTELVFGPETAFPMGYWEHELEYIYGTKKVREFLELHPDVKFVTGLSTLKMYVKGEESSPTARIFNDGSGNKFDYFNTVMQVEKEKDLQIYRKSRLVLGVEKMPFVSRIKILEKLSISLGGASGSLGTEKEPLLFTSKSKDGRDIKVIPAICYESIFSAYLAEFVRKGGNLLAIVTNDGWWGNTAGFEQHIAYNRLRAIELRRSIARSANTGISAFINQKGEIEQKSEWWVQAALVGTLNLNNELTFFAEYGDYFGRIGAFFAVLLVIWTLVTSFKKRII